MKTYLMILLALLLVGCPGEPKSLLPCDAHDHAAQVDLAANAAKAKVDRAHCNGNEACIQDVLDTRDRYVDERCKLPEAE